MAKPKLVRIEKKIEDSVVGVHNKIKDKFANKYFRKNDEDIDEVKERLRKNTR